jgi:hypothetical protein
MPERSGGVGEHPSVEVLSAYVDGTLDARERGDVETHLAACEECYELVTEVVASEEDIDAIGQTPAPPAPPVVSLLGGAPSADAGRLPSKVVPFVRRRWGMGVVAAFGAAAAAVLVVLVLPDGIARFNTGDAFDKLVAAVGDRRTVEGRLSADFSYGRFQPATRSGRTTENLTLVAAAGELQRAADANPTPENLHALAWRSCSLATMPMRLRR